MFQWTFTWEEWERPILSSFSVFPSAKLALSANFWNSLIKHRKLLKSKTRWQEDENFCQLDLKWIWVAKFVNSDWIIWPKCSHDGWKDLSRLHFVSRWHNAAILAYLQFMRYSPSFLFSQINSTRWLKTFEEVAVCQSGECNDTMLPLLHL